MILFADVLVVLAALIWLLWLVRAGLMAARIYQIEEYEAPRLLRWGSQRAWLWARGVLVGASVALVTGIVAQFLSQPVGRVVLAAGWLLGAIFLHALWTPLPAKKALVYTARVRRILSASVALALVMAIVAGVLLLVLPLPLAALLTIVLVLLAPGLTLLLLIGGNWLMRPVESAIQRSYVRHARGLMTEYAPLTIGVAGSYGKTSTKHILAHLLSPYMDTLPTPKSYNTLMGITRTVNEHLQPRHRAFVVEMDAYATGEIAAMCRLVDPQIAVITSVGPQHLERFGTVERIGDAIYELVASLPKGGSAVIYAGEPTCAQLADRAVADGYHVVRYGMNNDPAPLDVTASDVTIDARGTHFTWQWPSEKLTLQVRIPLLGSHNILNVSAALAAVHLLGFPVAEAVRDTATLQPVEHRLQVLSSAGGVTVIDDSYNANPVGINNGLDVLAQMQGRQKILVTPGLVELGPLEDEENQKLGAHAARVCDQVILVGARQTQPIRAGLQRSNFPAGAIHVVETLAEVTATLGRIAGHGDVVLFANDLPDTYLELKATSVALTS